MLTHLGEAQKLPDSAVPIESTMDSADTQIFPTDQKEKQNIQRKADKEAGIIREVKKRPKVVEDHSDDCGE